MENDYRKIDIEILKDFMDGEEHDVYLLIKKLFFKDMYMSLYEYCFKNLNEEDSVETFVETAFKAYREQNKLNQCLKIRDGKHHDFFLIRCVASEIYERYKNSYLVKNIPKDEFKKMIIEKEKNYIDNVLLNEYNVDLLISLIKDKFGSKLANVNDVADYIYELSKTNEKSFSNIKTFEEYLNEIIKENNITLYQLGNESLIKKGIYDLTVDKLPTKNQLIMISFALKLSKEKRLILFDLAKQKVENKSNSNMYNFDEDNLRDKLIIHWLNNIEELDKVAKKKNKYIVEVINDILESSNYDILK
jgi:hypothetical protein